MKKCSRCCTITDEVYQRSFSFIINGKGINKETNKCEYELELTQIDVLSAYQVYNDVNRKLNKDRYLLSLNKKEFLDIFQKNSEFIPTIILEDDNFAPFYVGKIINVTINADDNLILRISTKGFCNNSSFKKNLPVGELNNIRLQIDQTPLDALQQANKCKIPCNLCNRGYSFILNGSGIMKEIGSKKYRLDLTFLDTLSCYQVYNPYNLIKNEKRYVIDLLIWQFVSFLTQNPNFTPTFILESKTFSPFYAGKITKVMLTPNGLLSLCIDSNGFNNKSDFLDYMPTGKFNKIRMQIDPGVLGSGGGTSTGSSTGGSSVSNFRSVPL